MSDPRHVPVRCEAMANSPQFATPAFSCEFAAGHLGLHYAWPDPLPGGNAPFRWGSQRQLDQEIAIHGGPAVAR